MPWFHALSARRGFDDEQMTSVKLVPSYVMMNLDNYLVGRVYMLEKCSLFEVILVRGSVSSVMSSFRIRVRVDYHAVCIVDYRR